MTSRRNTIQKDLVRNTTNACTECTGLINHGIDSREQWESFRQIFDFMPVPESQDLTDKQD